MSPDDPSEISRIRISDAERDRAASIIGDALAEGRLTAEEHSERLDQVYAAKTHADIVPLVNDLPGATAALARPDRRVSRSAPSGSVAEAGEPDRMVAVFSGLSRKGSWQVPSEMEAVNVFGGTELDLREAVLPAGEIRIRAVCVFGGMEITVPPEMHVIDTGWALMGGREIPSDTDESASPDAPVLRLSGITVLGGISVRRKRRKGQGGGKARRQQIR